MLSHEELTTARNALLQRTVAFFAERPKVLGILLGGSLPAGSADAYSDIDLKTIATPDEQARLVEQRLESPSHWGDLLFNEWLEGAQHCVSHFRPFLKIDVFYLTAATFQPSPWMRLPTQVFLDRTGLVREVLDRSRQLLFPPPAAREVSRILSKAIAGAHEVIRRVRRGELFFAQSLLEELRYHMALLDEWIHRFEPGVAADLKRERRLSKGFQQALRGSYVSLDGADLETAVVDLCAVLEVQIRELHSAFAMDRSLEADLHAAELVRTREVA
jgi:hypothetical protein